MPGPTVQALTAKARMGSRTRDQEHDSFIDPDGLAQSGLWLCSAQVKIGKIRVKLCKAAGHAGFEDA
jgi:hypothetical protein